MQRVRHRSLIAALAATLAATPAAAQTLYVEAGRLIDGVTNDVRTGQCITVEAERIKAVAPCGATPAGATRLDWSGFTVLPGLIDLHTHLADLGQSADLAAPIKASPAETVLVGARNARVTLDAGFTSVRDVGTYRGLTDVTLRNAIERGDVPGPRMWVAGAYITMPKGGGELNGVVPNEELPADMRLGVAATPEEAAAKTTFLLDHGADFIKTIATGAVLAIGTEPGALELTEDYLRAVVKVAHARGKKVTAHAHGADGIKIAINAGVDSIEHASLADEEALQLAKARGTWLAMDIYNGDLYRGCRHQRGLARGISAQEPRDHRRPARRLPPRRRTRGQYRLRDRRRRLSARPQRAAIPQHGQIWHDPDAGDPVRHRPRRGRDGPRRHRRDRAGPLCRHGRGESRPARRHLGARKDRPCDEGRRRSCGSCRLSLPARAAA